MKRKFDEYLKAGYWTDAALSIPANKALDANIKKFEADVQNLRRQNYSKQEIADYVDEGLHQIKAKHWQTNETIRRTLESELDDMGEKWRRDNDRDPARGLLERHRMQSRFKLLSNDELQKYAHEYIAAEGQEAYRNPDELELAVEELERRGGKDLRPVTEQLRDTMRQRVYMEPWRYTEKGADLVDGIAAHSPEFGKALVRTVMETEIEGEGPRRRETYSELDIEELIEV